MTSTKEQLAHELKVLTLGNPGAESLFERIWQAASERPPVQVPCPVCGGEAVSHHDVLKRTIILAPTPEGTPEPAGYWMTVPGGARYVEPAPRPPLATLEGVPIMSGDTLYGLEGARYRAEASNRKDYPMRMIVLDKKPDQPDTWLTDTHFEGEQVLFWSDPTEGKAK